MNCEASVRHIALKNDVSINLKIMLSHLWNNIDIFTVLTWYDYIFSIRRWFNGIDSNIAVEEFEKLNKSRHSSVTKIIDTENSFLWSHKSNLAIFGDIKSCGFWESGDLSYLVKLRCFPDGDCLIITNSNQLSSFT